MFYFYRCMKGLRGKKSMFVKGKTASWIKYSRKYGKWNLCYCKTIAIKWLLCNVIFSQVWFGMAWSWNLRYNSCKNITFTWLILRLLIQNQRLFQVDYLGQPLRSGHTKTMSDRFLFHMRINFIYLVFSILVPIPINTNYLLIQKTVHCKKWLIYACSTTPEGWQVATQLTGILTRLSRLDGWLWICIFHKQ